MKNTLAIVQSIATQTLHAAPDVNVAKRILTERIGALSKAHDILLVGTHDAAPISDIVRSSTGLHDGGNRIRYEGPDVRLGPKVALTLALILHELSTNAGKHGALSVDTGVVDVEWSVAKDSGSGRLDQMFEWRELGGPPVMLPERKSFGTRLLEMGLSSAAEGSSEIDYAPEGVRYRITASLSELQSMAWRTPDRIRRRYVIRCYVAVGVGHAIEEITVVGRPDAMIAAAHLSEHCLCAVVIEPDVKVVERFGDVPEYS